MRWRANGLEEVFGHRVGRLIAPLFAVGSAVRKAPMLHPEGGAYRAEVEPATSRLELTAAAGRLEGEAVVRLSPAFWREGSRRPDILGFALRLVAPGARDPLHGDQDLLMGSMPRMWLLPLGLIFTDTRDYLRNRYHGEVPYDLEGVGRVWLRLSPLRAGEAGGSRLERLERAVEEGRAVFRLEVRLKGDWRWHPLAEIRLIERLEIEPEALRFDPTRVGRGLIPRGFLHALRPAVYAWSQRVRPAVEPPSAVRAHG